MCTAVVFKFLLAFLSDVFADKISFDGSQDRDTICLISRACTSPPVSSCARFAALRVQVFSHNFLHDYPPSRQNGFLPRRSCFSCCSAHGSWKCSTLCHCWSIAVISCNFPTEKFGLWNRLRLPEARAEKKTKSSVLNCFNLLNRKSSHSGAISFCLLNTFAFRARDQWT